MEFYQHLDPTNQYIQHMDQVDMLIHSIGFTCPVPYKTFCLTYESAWHLYLCQNVPCLPLQQDNTLNTWKERHLESFLKFTVPRPYKEIRWTYGEISHVEWCLGFPSLRPCRTNGLRYEESCHAESILKSTSPRPYLASTAFNKWTNLACWVIVKDLLPCALQKYTFKVVQQTNLFGILRRV